MDSSSCSSLSSTTGWSTTSGRTGSDGSFGSYLFVSTTLFIGTSINCIDFKLIRLTSGGGSLGLTGRSSVLEPEWSGSLNVSLAGRSSMWLVFCSDATLSRYCVQCTTASFEELKEATRFRERWRFRTPEVSRTLPVRHVDEIARLGTLSLLGGHSRDGPEMFLVLSQVLVELQISKRCRLRVVCGSIARACVPAGLVCYRLVPKQ